MAGNDFWQSMVNAAKSKTAEVIQFVKNDMNELSSAVNAEVGHYSGVVKREATNLLGNVNYTLRKRSPIAGDRTNPVRSLIKDLWRPDTKEDEVSPMIIVDSEPVPMTEVQYKHHLLVTDPKNFTEPFSDEEQRRVEDWLAEADEDIRDIDSLGKQLSDCPALADMYRTLVPDQVSHSDFWKRYFFRRHLLLGCYSRCGQHPVEEISEYDKKKQEDSENIPSVGDELFTVEVERPSSSGRAEENDWDEEFKMERLNLTEDMSLYDIISVK